MSAERGSVKNQPTSCFPGAEGVLCQKASRELRCRERSRERGKTNRVHVTPTNLCKNKVIECCYIIGFPEQYRFSLSLVNQHVRK